MKFGFLATYRVHKGREPTRAMGKGSTLSHGRAPMLSLTAKCKVLRPIACVRCGCRRTA